VNLNICRNLRHQRTIFRPHTALNRRLLAKSCTDLACVLYYGNRAAEAQAMRERALQIREVDATAKPEN
jgi:hypothetical protein